MKHSQPYFAFQLILLITFYNYVILQTASASEITVNAKLGESFTLNKGQFAKITDAKDNVVLEFNGFLVIPGRGIASGIFPSYRLLINGVIVEKYSTLPYDVEISHNYEVAVFTIWDSIQKCIQMKDGVACWSQLAKRFSNVEYCEKIPHGRGRDACIEYLIDETNQQELCERVDAPLMYCKYKQAIKEENPDICGDVIRWDYKNRCYKELAYIRGIAICDNLKKPSEKETCRDAVKKKETEK